MKYSLVICDYPFAYEMLWNVVGYDQIAPDNLRLNDNELDESTKTPGRHRAAFSRCGNNVFARNVIPNLSWDERWISDGRVDFMSDVERRFIHNICKKRPEPPNTTTVLDAGEVTTVWRNFNLV